MIQFIVFLLVYMFFQLLLIMSESIPYLNMVSDIQGYKFNMFKNLNNKFNFRFILTYIFIYLGFLYLTYYFIIKEHKSLLEGFLFVSGVYFVADFNILLLFDGSVSHLPVLFYDIFIVGGLCMVISQYIIYNYYSILKKYFWLLIILNILATFLGIIVGYQYNPDLSNIKGIVLF